MRDSYLLAPFLTFASTVAAICWVFVRRERLLRRLLTHDELPGVLSPKELQRCMRAWATSTERPSPGIALFLVRVDRYAEIGAMLRLGESRALLAQVAGRLCILCRSMNGIVARTGTDAFSVCIPNVDEANASWISSKLLAALSAPYMLGGRPLIAGFHIGTALHPEHGDNVDELQRCAQVALLPLKECGGHGWNLFDFRMLAHQGDQQRLENDLRLALTAPSMEQFELYYQPIYDSHNGVVKGCEALLRWHHPRLGKVSPAVTVKLAERTGLIVPLGAWVLKQACALASRWPAAWCVHVNLSVKQMKDGLVELVSDALATADLPPRRLVLEITESHFIRHYEQHVEILHALRANGVGLALDDFGCGYSSLSHLRSLPVDCVKIDRSFISGLEADARCRKVVSALLGLCNAMHLQVVVEGVETVGQLEILRSLGCRLMQGFLLGRPGPASETLALAAAMPGRDIQGAQPVAPRCPPSPQPGIFTDIKFNDSRKAAIS